MDRTITQLPNGGELHEYSDGEKYYYLHHNYHREDGCAVELINGTRYWYINGHLHRTDGPAIDCLNGNKYWYVDGVQLYCKNQEQFERLMKLKVFW
jgi:hypothetical protein